MNIDHQVYSETANPVPTLSKTKRGQKSGEAEQPIIGKSVFAILFVIRSERKLNETLDYMSKRLLTICQKAQDIHEYDYEDTHAPASCIGWSGWAIKGSGSAGRKLKSQGF